MIKLAESINKYYEELEEQLLNEAEDWRYKLLPLGSLEPYKTIDEYRINEFGIYTKNAQYWPDSKNIWKLTFAQHRDKLYAMQPLTFNNLELTGTIEDGEFAGNPTFKFNANEIRNKLKSDVKNSKLDLLKQYNVNTNRNYEAKIELSKNSNNIKISSKVKTEDGFAYVILFRDKFNNIFRYETPEKYLNRDLKFVSAITGRIDPSSIKEINAELGENPVLSMDMVNCNLDMQISEIKDLPPEEIKERLAQLNSNRYILNREEIISSQDKFHVDKKLDSYYKEDTETGKAKLVKVTQEKWEDLAGKADTFYKSNKLRQKRERWAVTDGNCIFANAATALLYYNEDIKHGNQLYDACEGIYGQHSFNDDRWRYATSSEILTAKPIDWSDRK